LVVGILGMTPVGVLCRPWLARGFGFVAHGYECWKDHPLRDKRRSRRWAARRASFAFAVSEHTARALSQMTGLARERIHLLPNTLEPSFETFGDGAAAEPQAAGPEILTVSRLWPQEREKGVDHMLAAFARLAPRYPLARYRIVGKGGDKPRLAALAASLGLGDRVTFHEDLSDAELAELYRRCAIFALPSGQEGFGIVFLEAMRFAKPCIGGDAGGTPEVVEHGRTGLLVPHGDVDALEAALERLLADPELRQELGRAGRRRLVERFSFESFRDALERHLRRLLEVPSGA
jgi:glycosyltransferase involved in cell wall biosynthesis